MKELNCLGVACPMPIILINKAMKDLTAGEQLKVVSDDGAFKMDVDDSIKPFNCGIGSDDRFVILDSSVKESIKTGISGLSQQHKDWAKQRREKRQQEETEQTKQSAGVTRF